MDSLYSEFIEQRVAVIFSDGESVKRREGLLKKATPDGVTLIDIKTKLPTLVPMSRIIRIEKIIGGEPDT